MRMNKQLQKGSSPNYFLKGLRDSVVVLLLAGLCLLIMYSLYY